MNAPAIAVFNNKGGVGKTSIIYHLASMLGTQGHRVVVADLDPQSNLTTYFVNESDLEQLWDQDDRAPTTVYRCLAPLLRGVGDVQRPAIREVAPGVALVPGDLRLSSFEDELSSQWPESLDGKERAFRVISALWRTVTMAAADWSADVVLLDVGPNLGAINRAAPVESDHVVIPLAPDLFSVQGMVNLGPRLRQWRQQWQERLARNPAPDLDLPSGAMSPQGYVLQQHGMRAGWPVNAYRRWMERIPPEFRRSVLGQAGEISPVSLADDPWCLGQLKHYRSLVPMAQDARKPVFELTPADGAFGGHQAAVQDARRDFASLAAQILYRVAAAAPAIP